MSTVTLILDQAAIEEALVDYIKKIGMNTDNATLAIDFTSTRNPTSYSATIGMTRDTNINKKQTTQQTSTKPAPEVKEEEVVEEVEETKEDEKEPSNEHARTFRSAKALFADKKSKE